MREIKLRAWFQKEKEMRKVSMNNVYEGNKTYLYLSPQPMSDYEAIKLMQYTGLMDRNKKDIYEGDIISDDTGRLKVISFEGGSFGCKVKKLKSFYSEETKDIFYSVYEYFLGGVELEVIGNIYENPELLEGLK